MTSFGFVVRRLFLSQETNKTDVSLAGNPGWGKTIVAASTICKLESKRSDSGEEPVVCYYFFNQADPLKSSTTLLAAYRAIVEQIFQKCHQIGTIHDIYALANDGSKSSASEHELRDLLHMIMPILPSFYLVLDGLDECSDIERLTDDIRRFCDTSSVKIIVFSRPHIEPLRQSFKPEQTITMSRTVMDEEIRVFVRGQLDSLRLKDRFPSHADYGSIEVKIVDQADGMFLWARLMICYLQSPALTKSARMTTIFHTTPVGLQELYDRILEQISHMDEASRRLASTIFTWTAYALEDLTSEECVDAFYPADAADDPSEKKDFVEHASIIVCCGLVERRQNTLRFIHLTAKQHVLALGSRGADALIPPPGEAHTEIAMRCLSYLLFSVPAQPLSGCPSTGACASKVYLDYPLLSYAATRWISHLFSCFTALSTSYVASTGLEKFKQIMHMIQKFLSFPFNVTVWIEAIYLFQKGDLIRSLEASSKLLQGPLKALLSPQMSCTSEALSLFASDIQDIDGDWGLTLANSPHEIWGDVSSFKKSRFIAQNLGISIDSLAPRHQDHRTKDVDVFLCIGRKSGDYIGKLTIFASS
jgi:hypothetical protein